MALINRDKVNIWEENEKDYVGECKYDTDFVDWLMSWYNLNINQFKDLKKKKKKEITNKYMEIIKNAEKFRNKET